VKLAWLLRPGSAAVKYPGRRGELYGCPWKQEAAKQPFVFTVFCGIR
jgi:hypothetical protein